MALQKRVLNWVLKPFRKKAPVPEKPTWKTASDIKKINIGTTVLGQRARGKVYAGNIQFKDGSRHRVAIKRFWWKLSDDKAMKYRQVINDLIKAGVRLPKTDMAKLPNGEWVQVSQLFGSNKQTKIMPTFGFMNIEKLETKIETIKEWTKIANAGYFAPNDIFGVFEGKVKGIIPYDIDMLAEVPKFSYDQRAVWLIQDIESMTENEPKQRKALLNIALKTASPRLKIALLLWKYI